MMEKNVVAQGALPQDRKHREKGDVLVQDALSRAFSYWLLPGRPHCLFPPPPNNTWKLLICQ